MKTTIVPAQVTTVEDKVAGNIGISQLLLLITPIFIGSMLFVVLPPFFNYSSYKLVLIICIVSFCATLAIRIRGKIVLFWIAVILQYNLRPRYYVYNKNDAYLRGSEVDIQLEDQEQTEESSRPLVKRHPLMSVSDIVNAENIMAHPNANFRLEINKKGKLSVRLTEIQ